VVRGPPAFQAENRKADAKAGKAEEDAPKVTPTSGEHRLSTYAKPQLNETKPQPQFKAEPLSSKSEGKAKPAVAATGVEGLTKAQKKNLKRTQTRAKKEA